MNSLIKNYVDKLKKDDIYKFGIKNGIVLEDEELNIIYKVTKNEYESLIENSDFIFNKYKDYLSNNNYFKIKKVFDEYKKRYQNYL